MSTKQATTVIGAYKFCPHCGVVEPFVLSAIWPHGKCRQCGKPFSDSRPLVAVPIFVHRGAVCAGLRGRGFRQGFLNLPGGFTEEHTDSQAVEVANQNMGRRLDFDNEVDGETAIQAAYNELDEETGYCGPVLKGRILFDQLATSMHERLIFVELVVADEDLQEVDPSGWFSPTCVRTPGELTDIRWIPLDELQTVEEWSFPIFHKVLSSFPWNHYPVRLIGYTRNR